MEGQGAPGAGGGGEEPLGSGRMNPKRGGRAAEEESRNKPKLVRGGGGNEEGGRGRRPAAALRLPGGRTWGPVGGRGRGNGRLRDNNNNNNNNKTAREVWGAAVGTGDSWKGARCGPGGAGAGRSWGRPGGERLREHPARRRC